MFAPGRVNLIGEHTDYNEGFVLPFALPFKTVIVGSRSKSKKSRIFSCTIPGTSAGPVEFEINESLQKTDPVWANYVKGTIFQYLQDLPQDSAFDAAISSNVPLGSGLSSSAALEVATATFLEELFSIKSVTPVTKALRCQKAEHDFADTPCGIMDQYISSCGCKGNLLLIDCRTQLGTLVPFGTGTDSPVVLVTNSNVQHTLSGSEYPDRVAQCKAAVQALKVKYPQLNSLRDAKMEMLDSIKTSIPEKVYMRARHVITEDIRTTSAVEALKRGDFESVGRFMSESHDSLQFDYEVSCPELDVLKRLALEVPGVFGSRMTGGGFGGCTVTLVTKASLEALKKHLSEKYLEQTGKQCTFYEAEPSEGAGVLSLEGENRNVPKYFDYLVPLGVAAIAAIVLLKVFSARQN